MKKNTYKSTDDLILGIRVILSKNRCSFTVEEQVLLEDCIKKLESTKCLSLDASKRRIEEVQIVQTIINIFSIVKNLTELF